CRDSPKSFVTVLIKTARTEPNPPSIRLSDWGSLACALIRLVAISSEACNAMFDENELKSAVEIQHRSYRLLRWLESAIQNGLIRLERAHQYSSESVAAEAWLSEHYFNLPPNCRPAEPAGPQFRRFASFFASYLITSFDLESNPRERRI